MPVMDKVLVYAPLNRVLALVDGDVFAQLREACATAAAAGSAPLSPLVDALRRPGTLPGVRRVGVVAEPAFLGIIPTRGCNMGCRYCDFAAPKRDSPVMPLATAKRAVDAYLELVCRSGTGAGHIQFFGGEPFYAAEVVRFVVDYAREAARRLDLQLHIEATSNGLYSEATCEWIAHHLDALVLSLDGPPDILDRQRPGLNGHSVAGVLVRNARILSGGPVELAIRACVTADTVHRLPEIAEWFVAEFRPKTVCFESLRSGPQASSEGLAPPDPFEFATEFIAAERVLSAAGIGAVFSTAEIDQIQTSFCPVGRDGLIVSPDGAIDACYLLEKDWLEAGLDLRLGRLTADGFDLSGDAVERVRGLSVERKVLCRDCFCRFHCAGGCHVHHRTDAPAGSFDRLCIQTRIVTLHRLLVKAGEPELADTWLDARDAVERSVQQENDRFREVGG